MLGDLPAHVTHVGAVLNAQDVEEELIDPGYDRTSRTLFIWESVPAHLTSNASDSVLSFVGKAPRGGKPAFSYASKALLTGEGPDNKVLRGGSRVMTKKCGLVFHGFNPKAIAARITKFRLAVRDHAGHRRV